MKKVMMGAGALVLVAVIGFGMWFYRPWAPFSPAGVWEGRNAEDRTVFYRNMSDAFPHRVISASPNFQDLPRQMVSLSDLDYTVDGQARSLSAYADENAITGMMVVNSGSVVFERYWRGEQASDLHTSWSVAKSVVALMIGMAVQEGVIDDIDDPVEKYAPIYQGTDYGSTSIRHLLMMSSGIDFIEDYESRGSDMRKLFFNVFFLNQDVDKFIRTYKRDREAGSDFVYQSPNTSVLSAVLRGAYGSNLSSIAEAKLFAPLGMGEGTWLLDRHAKDGKELGYCCLNIRLEDYAKLGLFMLANGEVDGRNLLPEGWVEFMSAAPQASHQPDLANGEVGYGQHIWLSGHVEGAFFMAGYNGQIVWVDPARDLVVAVTSADRNYPANKEDLLALIEAMGDWASAN